MGSCCSSDTIPPSATPALTIHTEVATRSPGYYHNGSCWYYLDQKGLARPVWSVHHGSIMGVDPVWLGPMTMGEPPASCLVDTRIGNVVEMYSEGQWELVRIDAVNASTIIYRGSSLEIIEGWYKYSFAAFKFALGKRVQVPCHLCVMAAPGTHLVHYQDMLKLSLDRMYRHEGGLGHIAQITATEIFLKPPRPVIPTFGTVPYQSIPIHTFKGTLVDEARLPVDLITDAKLDVKCSDGYYRTARIREVFPDGYFTVVCDDDAIMLRLPYNTEDIDVYGSRYKQRPPLKVAQHVSPNAVLTFTPIIGAPPPYT
jgi:hypothetical protein